MRKVYFLGIIIGLTAALLIKFIPPSKLNQFLTRFRKLSPEKSDISLLSNVSLKNLEIGGKKYFFTGGKVENEDGSAPTAAEIAGVTQLVFFYQWVKEDPLFTSPNFDLEGFEKSLKTLKIAANEYQKIALYQEKIFPFGLLDSLPAVFHREDDFFKNPSWENAQDLIKAYRVASLAYNEEASRYLQSLRDHQEAIGQQRFIFLSTYTTQDVILTDLEKIKKNGSALEEEINHRQNCLEQGKSCQRPSSSWGKPALKSTGQSAPEVLPQNVLFPLLTPAELKTIKGPYVVNSPCWGWGENFSFLSLSFYLNREVKTDFDGPSRQEITIFMPKLATTNYYRRLSNSPLESQIKKMGYQWIWQPDTNNYLCTNLEYQPKLATLDYFWQNFKDKPLLDGNPPQTFSSENLSFWQEAQKFEKDFFNLKIPDENSFQKLSQAYAFLYHFWPQDDSLKREELIKRTLLIERNLADFPLVLNKGVHHFARVTRQERLAPDIVDSEKYFYGNIYLYRNSWQILYFPFSSSFWRLNDHLDYLEKGTIETKDTKEPLYLTYQEAVKKFSKDEIKKLHLIAQEFIGEGSPF